MSSINKAIVIGFLGRDPEMKELPSGNKVVNMTVATSEKYKENRTTEWHNVVVWGTLAETCMNYLKKGSHVYIEGRLATRSYQKQGESTKRYVTEIICKELKFLSRNETQVDAKSSYGEDIPY